MEVYETLEKALGLIEREENWCQHGAGDGVNNFCIMSATYVATACPVNPPGDTPAFDAVRAVTPGGYPISFNNTHSHVEVCDLFRRAIAKAKADAGIYLEVPTKEPV